MLTNDLGNIAYTLRECILTIDKFYKVAVNNPEPLKNIMKTIERNYPSEFDTEKFFNGKDEETINDVWNAVYFKYNSNPAIRVVDELTNYDELFRKASKLFFNICQIIDQHYEEYGPIISKYRKLKNEQKDLMEDHIEKKTFKTNREFGDTPNVATVGEDLIYSSSQSEVKGETTIENNNTEIEKINRYAQFYVNFINEFVKKFAILFSSVYHYYEI